MASLDKIPYASQDPREVSALLQGLENGARKSKGSGGFSCKKNTFEVAGTEGVTVNSWRFQDWDYKRDDLPTYARGLFTYTTRNGTPEIAIRGYDKFFNVEEVNDTKWRSIESGTQGPYELSVKENGCIIFISGLEDDVLLVCSKHSTGARGNEALSHAIAGERWVDKHLVAIERTRKDLARELRRRNVTAVAELCDDTFEEHVLEYDEKSAGLYIHGMNLNLPEFATYPGPLVHKFADDWGFKKAQYLMRDDIETVKKFLETCAETGSWGGKDTEGFVIRCQKRQGGRDGPYADWFFKYKFEEPYLLYRQWRECTKAVIAGKVPKYRKHQKITEEYLLYARRQLAKDPSLGKAYNANHGIIKMRDDFLKERGLKGSDIIREEYAGDGKAGSDVTHNVILCPVATIGCGKTTIAFALTKLFGWGHVQNDNITGKTGRPKQFVTQICNNMAQHPVVIADRNSHQRRERKQVIDDVLRTVPDARFVALHYVHDPKSEKLPEIRQVTQARVLERGDNHQTIQAGTKSRTEIVGIMEGFLDRFEPLDTNSEPDNGFDEVIDLDVIQSSRQNLEVVVNALHNAYPLIVPDVPSPADLDDAIAAAMNDYTPDIKHDLSFQSKNKNKSRSAKENWREAPDANTHATKPKSDRIEYFALRLPSPSILSALESTFVQVDPAVARFYRQLQQSRRIQPSFHITLIHQSSSKNNSEIWQNFTSLHLNASSSDQGVPDPVLGKCRLKLEHVIWDNRVMCIVARLLDEGWEIANQIPHVTIGTADSSIKPKESNNLLDRWWRMGANEESGIMELALKGEVEVDGEAKAVMPSTR
ncbi:hypothetical protein MMC19_005273 [Ptychographa xylographoides]|nr:hypothetical protein [Ptychographa xylographoides]